MRFPRQSRIFRGQIDAAPLIGVFFLLLIFVILKSSLVFTPGIPVETARPAANPEGIAPVRTLRINPQGRLLYGTNIYHAPRSNDLARLKDKLRAEVQTGVTGMLSVRPDPGVPNDLVARIKNLARDLNLPIDVTGVNIELPQSTSLPGLADPRLIVAVDLSGRLFFENQAISEQELTSRLKEAVSKSKVPLTLVVQADRHAEWGAVVEVISRLAVSAGIERSWFATQPSPFQSLITPAP